MIPPFRAIYSVVIISEFDKEEFRAAKVDPLYQFSKPITVEFDSIMFFTYFFYHKAKFINCYVLPLLLFTSQSHMNKDHGEDTKLIVQHSLSIPVIWTYLLSYCIHTHTHT